MQIKAWHTVLRCFYRKQTLLQIKTADHENKTLDGLKPEVVDAWNFTLMQPIQEWSTSWSHYALEHYKTPHYPFQGGSHCLQGMSPLWSSLPGKVIKATLFCFTSMFLFSTVEQRPSFGKNYTIYYIRCVACDYVQVHLNLPGFILEAALVLSIHADTSTSREGIVWISHRSLYKSQIKIPSHVVGILSECRHCPVEAYETHLGES